MFPKAESFQNQVCEDTAQCDGDGDEISQDAGVHVGLVLPVQRLAVQPGAKLAAAFGYNLVGGSCFAKPGPSVLDSADWGAAMWPSHQPISRAGFEC